MGHSIDGRAFVILSGIGGVWSEFPVALFKRARMPKPLPAGFDCHDALSPSIASVKSTKGFSKTNGRSGGEWSLLVTSALMESLLDGPVDGAA